MNTHFCRSSERAKRMAKETRLLKEQLAQEQKRSAAVQAPSVAKAPGGACQGDRHCL